MGRHARAGGPSARTACGSGRATRTTSRSPSPSCAAWPTSPTTSCSTARWSRWARASRRSARCRTGCTCATRPGPLRLAERNPVTLIAFDLLRLDGEDLCDLPLSERRERLLGPRARRRRPGRCPPTYDDGADAALRGRAAGPRGHRQQAAVLALPARAAQQGLAEVPDPADRAPSSSAATGTRSGSEQPARRRARRAADRRPGSPSEAGSAAASPARPGGCSPTCSPRASSTHSPFDAELPRLDRLGTVWVEPFLVVDVQYLRITNDGRLRQPAYRGVRTDLTPADLDGPGVT